MTRNRTVHTAVAVAAAAVLTLTAGCAGDPGSKTASRGDCRKEMHRLFDEAEKNTDAPEVTETPEACTGFTESELEDMAAEVMKKEIDDAFDKGVDGKTGEEDGDGSDTELQVGETFTYKDGLSVTVDSIDKLTRFGEYDDRPEAGQTAFRINLTVDNGSKKAVDLDSFGINAQGATNGGETTSMYVTADAKEMTGRVATGVKTAKTADYAIDAKYGKTILVTLTRMDESTDLLSEDPSWTGDIK